MPKAKDKKKKVDVYEMVQERILDALDQGTIPWRKPWKGGDGPANLKSKKRYRGINVFLLGYQALAKGYSSRYWVTFPQAKALAEKQNPEPLEVRTLKDGSEVKHFGGVRKGEKSTVVVFWKFLDKKKDGKVVKDEKTGKPIKIPLIRYYRVFNIEQCDGITDPDSLKDPVEFEPIDRCVQVVDNMPKRPKISHGGDVACYAPHADSVRMPKPESFDSPEHYYSTTFHELSHSTGHKSRLNRDGIENFNGFGTHEYSKEELIAEMSAAMLCGVCNIEGAVLDNAASYIDHWRKKISEDKRLVVTAAGAAQRAADFILDRKREEKDPEQNGNA
jgi:antirestriction protein ArdC